MAQNFGANPAVATGMRHAGPLFWAEPKGLEIEENWTPEQKHIKHQVCGGVAIMPTCPPNK